VVAQSFVAQQIPPGLDCAAEQLVHGNGLVRSIAGDLAADGFDGGGDQVADRRGAALFEEVFDGPEHLRERLPLADPPSLTGAQRALFDSVTATHVPWANDAGLPMTA
jgi:hypothetical protein